MTATPPPLPPLRDREAIALLPPFDGLGLADITVVESAEDAERAGQALLAAGVVGFDTESKPTFARHEVSGGPHVVQFATPQRAWLFQSHRAALQPVLAALIASPALVKAGFGLATDLTLIRGRLGIEPAGILDLDTEFRRRGYRQSVGVKAAVALVFDRRFVKSRKATTSNWANPRLTDAQIRYAANDAYAAIRVHAALGLAPRTAETGKPT